MRRSALSECLTLFANPFPGDPICRQPMLSNFLPLLEMERSTSCREQITSCFPERHDRNTQCPILRLDTLPCCMLQGLFCFIWDGMTKLNEKCGNVFLGLGMFGRTVPILDFRRHTNMPYWSFLIDDWLHEPRTMLYTNKQYRYERTVIGAISRYFFPWSDTEQLLPTALLWHRPDKPTDDESTS